MSQPFEDIIRPFQTPDTAPPQRYVTPGQQSQAPVILTWGRNGQGRTYSGSYSITVNNYMEQQVVEQTTPDPNDPDGDFFEQ